MNVNDLGVRHCDRRIASPPIAPVATPLVRMLAGFAAWSGIFGVSHPEHEADQEGD
jgi:hypothetical protein